MHATTLNIAFLVYVGFCCVMSVMCLVFILVDDSHETLYASIITFILGKLTAMMMAKQGKSMRKQMKEQRQSLVASSSNGALDESVE